MDVILKIVSNGGCLENDRRDGIFLVRQLCETSLYEEAFILFFQPVSFASADPFF